MTLGLARVAVDAGTGEHRVDAGGQSQPSDLGSMADTLPCPGMAPAWFPAAELCQV